MLPCTQVPEPSPSPLRLAPKRPNALALELDEDRIGPVGMRTANSQNSCRAWRASMSSPVPRVSTHMFRVLLFRRLTRCRRPESTAQTSRAFTHTTEGITMADAHQTNHRFSFARIFVWRT